MRSEAAWDVTRVSGSVLGVALWGCGVFACQPPPAMPAENVPTVTASPPATGAGAATTVKDELSLSAGATLPPQDLECVTGADPDLDKESPWSKETGERLDKVLPRLAPCTRGLPVGEHEITMRLVYGPDGSSISQHVVRSTAASCDVAACLMRELTSVPSPKLLIERASYDIGLVLERGAVRRTVEPPAVLASDDEDPSGAACVDPAVAALSRSKIKEVVSTSFPDLKICYGQALVRDHSATGNVTFEFVIGQAGKVARAQVRDATLPDCAAIQCMLAEFRGLEFPAPVGRSVRIIYPINYVVEQDPVMLR